MSDVLIRVDNVSKRFCRSLKRSLWYGLQDLGSEISGQRHGGGSELPQCSRDLQLRRDEFWALKDVSFELRRGECLGLIGRNGAGKTTLLRMLNGLIKPDTGSIELRGRVGALIALGSGFNPVLTGRENIYINGTTLGMPEEEINIHLDRIIEFSELEDFIDSPVQSYSSGMGVRLGFSIAAIMTQPDVLLLDEVLAVGDIGFTIKCLNHMRETASKSAVVFVSHSMQFVSTFCTSTLVMKGGVTQHLSTDVSKGIVIYLKSCASNIIGDLSQAKLVNIGSGEVHIEKPELTTEQGSFTQESQETIVWNGEQARLGFTLNQGHSAHLDITIYIVHMFTQAVVAYKLKDPKNGYPKLPAGSSRVQVDMGKLDFTTGTYSFTIVASDPSTGRYKAHVGSVIPFNVEARECEWAYIMRYPEWQRLSTR